MQWIPKTAWRKANLNKTYGKSMIGLSGSNVPKPFFVDQEQPKQQYLSSARAINEDAFKELLRLYRKGVPFLDLRDMGEIQSSKPIRRSVSLHHHDLLSGACNNVLPDNKDAYIVVFSSNRQRSVNGYNALRRWGYENIIVADYHTLQWLDEPGEMKQMCSEEKSAPAGLARPAKSLRNSVKSM